LKILKGKNMHKIKNFWMFNLELVNQKIVSGAPAKTVQKQGAECGFLRLKHELVSIRI